MFLFQSARAALKVNYYAYKNSVVSAGFTWGKSYIAVIHVLIIFGYVFSIIVNDQRICFVLVATCSTLQARYDPFVWTNSPEIF